MATISTLVNAGGTTPGTKQWKVGAQLYSVDIDFADALREKGSALAALDVIEAIRFPAGSWIHWAGIQTLVADNATTLTLDLGITGGDVDGFVDGYDQGAAVAGAYATPLLDATDVGVIYSTADSIDVLFATLTGTLSTGKIRVFALITPLGFGDMTPGLAQIGS